MSRRPDRDREREMASSSLTERDIVCTVLCVLTSRSQGERRVLGPAETQTTIHKHSTLLIQNTIPLLPVLNISPLITTRTITSQQLTYNVRNCSKQTTLLQFTSFVCFVKSDTGFCVKYTPEVQYPEIN